MRVLHTDIRSCGRCGLASARQGVAPGIGPVGAKLLVVGDFSLQEGGFSPETVFGTEEDAMLWNMMRAIGLSPEQVYVANAVKCCPDPAVAPGEEHLQNCRSHLVREIELVRPRVLCAMGEAAARLLVGGTEPIARLRGRFHPFRPGEGTAAALQVMVTYHPRFLLKHAELKKAAWQDLQMIQRVLSQP